MKLQKIGSGILAFSFLFLIGVSSSTTQAQDGYQRDRYERDRYEQEQRRRQRQQRRQQTRGYGQYNDGYSALGGSFQLRQTALNAGANEGIKEGRKDRSRRERFDFTDEGAFQSATKDYSSRLGDRELIDVTSVNL